MTDGHGMALGTDLGIIVPTGTTLGIGTIRTGGIMVIIPTVRVAEEVIVPLYKGLLIGIRAIQTRGTVPDREETMVPAVITPDARPAIIVRRITVLLSIRPSVRKVTTGVLRAAHLLPDHAPAPDSNPVPGHRPAEIGATRPLRPTDSVRIMRIYAAEVRHLPAEVLLRVREAG